MARTLLPPCTVMAFDAATHNHIEREVAAYVDSVRPPALCRDEFDVGYRVYDQSIEIFEIQQAPLRADSDLYTPVAKATYVRTRNVWKLYHAGRDGHWYAYNPLPEVTELTDVFQAIDKDTHGCFGD